MSRRGLWIVVFVFSSLLVGCQAAGVAFEPLVRGVTQATATPRAAVAPPPAAAPQQPAQSAAPTAPAPATALPAPPTQPAAPAPTQAAKPVATPATGTVKITGPGSQAVDPAKFDENRAYQHVVVLAKDIGKRVAGTEGSKRGIDYIKQQFEAIGLQTELQPFPVRSFEEKLVKLSTTTPEAKDIGAQALIYSPSGKVTASLVAVPNLGRPEDYRNLDVRGKIVLVQRGQFFLSDKVKNAVDKGAVAVVIYNTEPQVFTGTLRERGSVPSIAVSGESGQALLNLLKRGPVTATIEVETDMSEKQGHNVIARRPGNDQVFVFGGHIDSVQTGPGANDNASGTAVVLELARVLAQSNRPETLIFVGFDAEESGLVGSRAYVEKLSEAERKRIKAMFNFDMLGATENDFILIGSKDLTELAATSAKALGITGKPGDLDGGGSDHQSFLDAGIPAIFFFRNDPLFHTPQDTHDRVLPANLAAAGKTALGMLQRMP